MSMKEWGEAWQWALLARRRAANGPTPYEWAENAVAALFAVGWMAAILSGRL